MPMVYKEALMEMFGEIFTPAQIHYAIMYKVDEIIYLSMPGRVDEMMGLGSISQWKWQLLMYKKAVWEGSQWQEDGQ